MMIPYSGSFWALPKHNQKRLLEEELRNFLNEHQTLSACEKYFLTETLGHLYAGRYELGRDSVDDVYESPELSAACSGEICEAAMSVTQRKLMRALRYIEGAPTQEIPIFR
jgi:hypothetical protein